MTPEISDNALLAHIGEAGPQSLSSHLLGVSKRTGELAENLGLRRARELLGLLHDLGKASTNFSNTFAALILVLA